MVPHAPKWQGTNFCVNMAKGAPERALRLSGPWHCTLSGGAWDSCQYPLQLQPQGRPRRLHIEAPFPCSLSCWLGLTLLTPKQQQQLYGRACGENIGNDIDLQNQLLPKPKQTHNECARDVMFERGLDNTEFLHDKKMRGPRAECNSHNL